MQHGGAGRDTKAEIHRAALELFSSRGYQKTSLREIAEQVGITKASLYYHYSSKQDLLQAIMGDFLEDLLVALQRVDEVEWSPEAERELLKAYVGAVTKHRETGPTLVRDIAAVLAAFGEDLERLVAASQRFQRWLAGPEATPADRLLAGAALETVGAALTIGTGQEVGSETIQEVILDAAMAVLSRRQGRPGG